MPDAKMCVVHIFVFLAAGLMAVIFAAKSSARTGVAAPLLLLCLGIAASFPTFIPNVELDPELVLAGFLPPLLFSTASNMPVVDLRRNAGMIIWLSMAMVVVPAVIIGIVIHVVFPEISIALAIALGAVVSPIDAVAATSIGKRLGLPPRLMAVLEGESLFNDASALVTLRTALAAIAGSFSLWQAAGSFLWATVAGIAVGFIVGNLVIKARGWLADPVLSTSVALLTPWTAFFIAEELEASGVIAVVVAGIICGHKATRHLSAADRNYSATMWTVISFILEHLVFLLMGLQIADLFANAEAEHNLDFVWQASLIVFGLLLVMRFGGVAVAVAGTRITQARSDRKVRRLDAYTEKFNEAVEQNLVESWRAEKLQRRLERSSADIEFARSTPITRRGALVLSWAGMRGVVTLAAAQTISVSAAGEPIVHRSSIILVAFLVAVATLIVFGGTLPALIRALKFSSPSAQSSKQEVSGLMTSMLDSAVAQLGPMSELEIDGKSLSPGLAKKMEQRIEMMMRAPTKPHANFAQSDRELLHDVQEKYLEALQDALDRERAIGAYSAKTFHSAQRRLDMFEDGLDMGR